MDAGIELSTFTIFYMSRGSLMETETQLIAAVRQQMCSREAAREPWEQLQHTGRLLNKLIASLEHSQ
jgi:four helix bundle protein